MHVRPQPPKSISLCSVSVSSHYVLTLLHARVQHDIVQELALTNPKVFVQSFNRENIEYQVRYKRKHMSGKCSLGGCRALILCSDFVPDLVKDIKTIVLRYAN